MKRGECNVCEFVIGRPGCGKSTWASKRALAYRKAGCMVIGYDPGYRLPKTDGWIYCDSAETARDTLANSIKRGKGMPVLARGTAMEVLTLAQSVAESCLEKSEDAPPVIVVLDESISSVDVLGQYRLNDGPTEWIMARRHNHCGLIATAQTPTTIHYAFLGAASGIAVGPTDERGKRRLMEAGVPEEVIERSRKLPKYSFLFHKL